MSPPDLTPLPRGRHKLPRRKVVESQRARIVRAMFDCVAEQGYTATTVADVVARARVSRNAFFDLFGNKQNCYLEACDEANRELLAAMYEQNSASTWVEALRRGMDVYLRWWVDWPGYAYGYLVELPTAGRPALDQRDRVHAEWCAMFEALAARARHEQPELPDLPPLALRMLVSSVTELVGAEVRAGRLDQLDELADDLLFHVVRTLGDDKTARRAVTGSKRRRRVA